MSRYFGELTKEERIHIGWEYKQNAGEDGFVRFLFVVIGLALCFTIPLGICGVLWRDILEGSLIWGAICCALSFLLLAVIYPCIRLKKKRAVKRKARAEELLAEFGKEVIDKCVWCYEDKQRGGTGEWLTPEERYWNMRVNKASAELEAAVNRQVSQKMGLGSYSSSTSDNSMRVKMKDGSELHTEERFGDYKTYLYDKDGKNTGLHVQGDKVLDDNYNEVGHFDSTGKFNPKN